MLTVAAKPAEESLLALLYRPIAADLEQAERILVDELASDVPYVQALVDHLGHYRGKRLRPALLLLTAKACGQVKPEHHTLAAVVEMIHTATLVHDDILDHAEMRRHVPTVNAKWGNSNSVLLGDLLFTHSFYLASTTGSTIACRLIGEATNRVCQGELQQIGERGNLTLGEKEYFSIIRGKTAELTACCSRLGALFSNASEDVVEAMTRYGRHLGIAFQIADDILDLLGREQDTGKTLGTDLEERKLTLPIIRLLQQANPERSLLLRQILSSPENHRLEKLRPHLEESDAIGYATDVAEQHTAKARAELEVLRPSECRQILEKLTHLVVHRNR